MAVSIFFSIPLYLANTGPGACFFGFWGSRHLPVDFRGLAGLSAVIPRPRAKQVGADSGFSICSSQGFMIARHKGT